MYPKHPIVDEELVKFVSFARNLRLPGTRRLIEERAQIIATTNDVSKFKASNGYIQNFIRRTGVHKSVRLHGKGGSSPLPEYAAKMVELRIVTSNYWLKNIYNVNVTGLFYRMGPRKSYLSFE